MIASSMQQQYPSGIPQMDRLPYVSQRPSQPPPHSPHPSLHSATSAYCLPLQHSSNPIPSSQQPLPYGVIDTLQPRYRPPILGPSYSSSENQLPAEKQRSQQFRHCWDKPSGCPPPTSYCLPSFEASQLISQIRYFQSSTPTGSAHIDAQFKLEHQQRTPLFYLQGDRIMSVAAVSESCGQESDATFFPFTSSGIGPGMSIQNFLMPGGGVAEAKRLPNAATIVDDRNECATEPDTSDEDEDDDEYDPAATKMHSKASGPRRVMPHRPTEVADKESGKPYAKLVYEALSSAPQCQMAVSEIYDYFKHHYPQFRAMKGRGWMNSIRYNLSMNEGFELVKRPNGDNGKGGLWQLTPTAQKHGIKSTTRSRQTTLPRKRQTSTRCSPRSTRRQTTLQPYAKSVRPTYEDYEEQIENETDHGGTSSYDESLGPLTPPTQECFTPTLDDQGYGSQESTNSDQSSYFVYQQQSHGHGSAFSEIEEISGNFLASWDGALPSPPVEYYHFDPYQTVPVTAAPFTDSSFEEQLFITRYGFGNATPIRETFV